MTKVNIFKISISDNIVTGNIIISGEGFLKIITLKGFLKRDSI